MGFLPKTMGTRPRLACEIQAEGVVAARADDSAAALSAAEHVAFSSGVGNGNGTVGANGASRAEKVAAVRRTLDAVSQRGREVTLVVPDTSARVLLVDFDELPAKAAEALPVVRFRLKKLLPFDADDAAVSYQVMSQTRSLTQVLAVAMPREVLAEYEGIVREAGYEPGAVLPSTLAVLAGLDKDAGPALVVNAGRESVTTAIVKDGVLLLHRTVNLGAGEAVTAVAQRSGEVVQLASAISADESVGAADAAATASDNMDEVSREASQDTTIAAIAARFAAMEGQTMPATRALESPQLSRVNSALASAMATQGASAAGATTAAGVVKLPSSDAASAEEIAQAVNVAAAYFEDTLARTPEAILSAGTLGAEALARIVGVSSSRVEEMVSGTRNDVPAGWLAGVQGALRS